MDRPPARNGESIVFGPFTLDPNGGRLWRYDTVVPLRRKALEVLRYLAHRRGEVVSNEELLDAVWPDVHVTPQTLTNVIREIRLALDDLARAPRFIQTLHRQGHVLLAETAIATELRPHTADIVVGRDTEMRELETLWREVLAGRSRIAFVTGEPGIGKTTLVAAAVRAFTASEGSARAPHVLSAHGSCVEQHGQDEAYVPLLTAVDDLLGGTDGAEVMATLRRCAPTWLVQLPWRLSTGDQERLEQALLGTSAARTLREGITLLRGLATSRPLVLVLEDLHWSDLATVDLIAAIARRPIPAPIFLLCTYRRVDAAVRAHPLVDVARDLRRTGAAVEIGVPPFDEAAVEAYLQARFASGDFPAHLMARLVVQSAGNPLFLRALVDQLVARGAIAATDDRWRLAGEADAVLLELPQSLRDSVMAELDVMDPERRAVVEAASVAGFDFTVPEVAAALPRAPAEVEKEAEALVRIGRLLRLAGETEAPDRAMLRRYAFVHAAHHQIVYEQIAPLRRARLHRDTATGLEEAWGDRVDLVAPRLATHFAKGGNGAKAIEYFDRAAVNAERRFAYRESAAYLRNALAHFEDGRLDSGPALRAAGLWARLGALLALVLGFSAAETEDAFVRAHAIFTDEDSPHGSFMMDMALCRLYLSRAEIARGRRHSDRMLELARTRVPELTVFACCWAGCTESLSGDLPRGRALLEEAAQAPPAPGLIRHHDVHRIVGSQLAQVLTGMGELALASATDEAALARSLAANRTADLAHAHVQSAERAMFMRDHEAGHAAAERAIAAGEESELQSFMVLARFYRAAADAGSPAADRLAEMERAIEARHALGDHWQDSVLYTLLAELQLEIGDLDAVARTLDEAATYIARSQERHHESEIMRLRGELAFARAGNDGLTDAAASFRRAIELAHGCGAGLWKLRAANALARLPLAAEARTEAFSLLSTTLARFTADAGGADVATARRLLASRS